MKFLLLASTLASLHQAVVVVANPTATATPNNKVVPLEKATAQLRSKSKALLNNSSRETSSSSSSSSSSSLLPSLGDRHLQEDPPEWNQLGTEFVGTTNDRLKANWLTQDGGRIAIGAPGQDNYVKVYDLAADGNHQQVGSTLTRDADKQWPQWGYENSISMNDAGTLLAIGHAERENGANGYVRVYSLDQGNDDWVQYGQDMEPSDIPDGSNRFGFGWFSQLSGDGSTVIVAAPYSQNRDQGGTVVSNGMFYVYSYNTGTSLWEQKGQTLTQTESSGGYLLAISRDGTVIAFTNVNYNGGAGRAEVYQYNAGTNLWERIGDFPGGPGQTWHSDVRLSADGLTVGIGQWGYNNNKGRVQIWTYNGTPNDWTLSGDINGDTDDQFFGYTFDMTDNAQRFVAHAKTTNGDTTDGYFKIFDYDTTDSTWNAVGMVSAPASRANNYNQVSLSGGDGSIFAYGTFVESVAVFADPNGGSPGGSTTSSGSSGVVDLAELWKVELSPTTTYADGVFTVDYTLGSQVAVTPVIGVYKSCPGSELPLSENTLSGDAVTFEANTDSKSFTVRPDIKDAGDIVWREGEEQGKKVGVATFCYAVQLPNSANQVVSMAQMNIEIEYALEGDFSVTAFATEAVDTLEENKQDDDRAATASICPDSTGSGTNGAYQPGDVFCVKVCSAEAGFVVTEILTLEAQGQGLQQTFESVPGSQTFFDTTEDNCGQAQFILNAAFFPTTGAGSVQVKGSCRFDFAAGRRRLGLGGSGNHQDAERALQEGQGGTGAFEMEIALTSKAEQSKEQVASSSSVKLLSSLALVSSVVVGSVMLI